VPAPPLLLLAMLSTVAVLVGREAVGEGEGEEVAVGVARILRLLVGEAVPLRPAERLPEAVLPARLAVAQAEGLAVRLPAPPEEALTVREPVALREGLPLLVGVRVLLVLVVGELSRLPLALEVAEVVDWPEAVTEGLLLPVAVAQGLPVMLGDTVPVGLVEGLRVTAREAVAVLDTDIVLLEVVLGVLLGMEVADLVARGTPVRVVVLVDVLEVVVEGEAGEEREAVASRVKVWLGHSVAVVEEQLEADGQGLTDRDCLGLPLAVALSHALEQEAVAHSLLIAVLVRLSVDRAERVWPAAEVGPRASSTAGNRREEEPGMTGPAQVTAENNTALSGGAPDKSSRRNKTLQTPRARILRWAGSSCVQTCGVARQDSAQMLVLVEEQMEQLMSEACSMCRACRKFGSNTRKDFKKLKPIHFSVDTIRE
jgi:hypothetical protein